MWIDNQSSVDIEVLEFFIFLSAARLTPQGPDFYDIVKISHSDKTPFEKPRHILLTQDFFREKAPPVLDWNHTLVKLSKQQK